MKLPDAVKSIVFLNCGFDSKAERLYRIAPNAVVFVESSPNSAAFIQKENSAGRKVEILTAKKLVAELREMDLPAGEKAELLKEFEMRQEIIKLCQLIAAKAATGQFFSASPLKGVSTAQFFACLGQISLSFTAGEKISLAKEFCGKLNVAVDWQQFFAVSLQKMDYDQYRRFKVEEIAENLAKSPVASEEKQMLLKEFGLSLKTDQNKLECMQLWLLLLAKSDCQQFFGSSSLKNMSVEQFFKLLEQISIPAEEKVAILKEFGVRQGSIQTHIETLSLSLLIQAKSDYTQLFNQSQLKNQSIAEFFVLLRQFSLGVYEKMALVKEFSIKLNVEPLALDWKQFFTISFQTINYKQITSYLDESGDGIFTLDEKLLILKEFGSSQNIEQSTLDCVHLWLLVKAKSDCKQLFLASQSLKSMSLESIYKQVKISYYSKEALTKEIAILKNLTVEEFITSIIQTDISDDKKLSLIKEFGAHCKTDSIKLELLQLNFLLVTKSDYQKFFSSSQIKNLPVERFHGILRQISVCAAEKVELVKYIGTQQRIDPVKVEIFVLALLISENSDHQLFLNSSRLKSLSADQFFSALKEVQLTGDEKKALPKAFGILRNFSVEEFIGAFSQIDYPFGEKAADLGQICGLQNILVTGEIRERLRISQAQTFDQPQFADIVQKQQDPAEFLKTTIMTEDEIMGTFAATVAKIDWKIAFKYQMLEFIQKTKNIQASSDIIEQIRIDQSQIEIPQYVSKVQNNLKESLRDSQSKLEVQPLVNQILNKQDASLFVSSSAMTNEQIVDLFIDTVAAMDFVISEKQQQFVAVCQSKNIEITTEMTEKIRIGQEIFEIPKLFSILKLKQNVFTLAKNTAITFNGKLALKLQDHFMEPAAVFEAKFEVLIALSQAKANLHGISPDFISEADLNEMMHKMNIKFVDKLDIIRQIFDLNVDKMLQIQKNLHGEVMLQVQEDFSRKMMEFNQQIFEDNQVTELCMRNRIRNLEENLGQSNDTIKQKEKEILELTHQNMKAENRLKQELAQVNTTHQEKLMEHVQMIQDMEKKHTDEVEQITNDYHNKLKHLEECNKEFTQMALNKLDDESQVTIQQKFISQDLDSCDVEVLKAEIQSLLQQVKQVISSASQQRKDYIDCQVISATSKDKQITLLTNQLIELHTTRIKFKNETLTKSQQKFEYLNAELNRLRQNQDDQIAIEANVTDNRRIEEELHLKVQHKMINEFTVSQANLLRQKDDEIYKFRLMNSNLNQMLLISQPVADLRNLIACCMKE